MSNPFSYAELHTKDPAAAKTFYGSLFEWKMSDHPNAVGTYTEIDLGAGFPAGLLKVAEKAGLGSHWLPYVKVTNVLESTIRAKKLGATVLQDVVEIPEGQFSMLTDPTGAPFGLFQPSKG